MRLARVRATARLMVLGASLGVGGFVITAVLGYRLVSALLQTESRFAAVALFIIVRLLGVLLVAPALAYAAGLLIEGPRALLTASMVVVMQATQMLLQAAADGFEVVASPLGLALLLAGTAAGMALCRWSMGRGQRRGRGSAPARKAAPIEPAGSEGSGSAAGESKPPRAPAIGGS